MLSPYMFIQMNVAKDMHVERLSLSAGVNYIYGHVHPDNHAMRRLNHKLGYSADGKMMYKHIDMPDD